MARKTHLIVDSGCTQDNERWALSACGLNEDSEVSWDGTHKREFVSCKRCQAKMAKPRPAPEPFHKERPILFSGAMVRAILSGQKTVTRRLVKGNQIPSRSKSDSPEHQWIAVVQDHPRWGFAAFGATEQECAAELAMYGGCPYGRRGDRLWVREAWAEINVAQAPGESWVVYRECDNRTDYGGPWKPSIHMRRRDSRILLEITDVRVERLQAGEGETAFESRYVAEGINRIHQGDGDYAFHPFKSEPGPGSWTDPFDAWRELWVGINGAESWNANPWVWVVEFKRVTP